MTAVLSSVELRRELSARARAYAERESLPYYESLGGDPAVLFEPQDDGRRHGNFLDASFERIAETPGWLRRLSKTHTSRQAIGVEHRGETKELDSCNSSDALLMSVFCYPGVLATGVSRFFGCSAGSAPEFGFRARVPFRTGRADNTEIDMRLGDTLVEAKLTEAGFGTLSEAGMARYRDAGDVFDHALLPRTVDGRIVCAQLLRNVLAAHHHGVRFRLLYDVRRRDLLEDAYATLRAVTDAHLRARCGVITWQELAALCPDSLRAFLGEKYGIE